MRTLYRWLKDEGAFGWNYWYLITHPWVICYEVYFHTKWFIQRGWRGYADCDAWGLDSYLARWMPTAIRALKGGPGFPTNAYEDLFGPVAYDTEWPDENCKAAHAYWQQVLEEIARGFEAASKIENMDWKSPEELESYQVEATAGLDLFKHYYFNLWD